MKRTIVVPEQAGSPIAPGVVHKRIKPGGRRGPNDEVLANLMGGQTWSEMYMFGKEEAGGPMVVPDIRLPANQYWPPHWHSCWIAVIILDGACRIGDWDMGKGDVLISENDVEYGPLLIGPDGCQMFEIFARLHPVDGGYAPEFGDHPTLDGTARPVAERSARNAGNAGRQVLSVEGVEGLFKDRLRPGAQWDLGSANDPERSIVRCTFLSAGERVPAHSYADLLGLFVLDGQISLGDGTFTTDDVIAIEANAAVPEMVAGPAGAQLLEVSRKAIGIDRRPVA